MAVVSAFPVLNLLGNNSSTAPVYVSPSSSVASTGASTTLTTDFKSALFFVNVNQAPANSSQFLNVYVQHSPDGGTTFDDYVSILISGKQTSNKTTAVAQWVRDYAASSSLASNFVSVRTPATRALANNTVLQGPIGSTWRAEAVCGSSASSSQAWQLNVSTQFAQ